MTLKIIFAVAAALLTAVLASPIPDLSPVERAPMDGRYLSLFKKWCNMKPKLICNLVPTAKSTVSGTVMYSPVWKNRKCMVQIQASISGLAPNSKQAIHIHKYGDLRQTNGKSLGGHFMNPGGHASKHGLPSSPERHWGDFGSLKADAQGNAKYSRVDKMISIMGIVGRGMVVHAGEDKGPLSQPSGGAGPRKAMCVIGYANPKIVWKM